MEYINEVNINEASLHVLDKNSDKPVYNEYILNLTDETYEYILKHITRILKNDNLKYAVFNDEENNVKNIAKAYFDDRNQFLDVSKELAKELFDLMRKDTSIPSGDILIASILTEYGPMLCILKMDYIKSYSHDIKFIDGKQAINIITRPGDLPNRQTVERAAFIKPIRKENKFDLMFFDKGIRKNSVKKVEDYFKIGFMKCSFIENERDQTRKLINITEAFTRSKLQENASAAEYFRSTIQKRLKENDVIAVDDIMEDLQDVFPRDILDELETFIENQEVSSLTKVDKKYVDKKLKGKKLCIDKDIDIFISLDAYSDKSKFEIIRNEDGSISMTIKNIKSYIEK